VCAAHLVQGALGAEVVLPSHPALGLRPEPTRAGRFLAGSVHGGGDPKVQHVLLWFISYDILLLTKFAILFEFQFSRLFSPFAGLYLFLVILGVEGCFCVGKMLQVMSQGALIHPFQ